MATILVVDDSQLIRKGVVEFVRKEGHEPLEAVNGAEALEKIDEYVPDCILLDLIMPDLRGFEVLKTLRERKSGIPVIVLTADIQEDTRKECLELGAVNFLNKPPNEEDVRHAIRSALRSGKGVSK